MRAFDRAERSRLGVTESIDDKLNHDLAMDLRFSERRWVFSRRTLDDCGGSINNRRSKHEAWFVWVHWPQCRIAALLRRM